MKKFIVVTLFLCVLGGCGDSYLDERHEHGGVVCVYKVKRNFWGTHTFEKEVACR